MPSPNASPRSRARNSDAAILDVAEFLLAQHGPDGVSFRQIASAAGLSNHFAVQYHFKDKKNLIQAIFDRRLESLEIRREERLHAILAEKREGDVRSLLEAMFLPLAEERDSTGRRSYAAFLLSMSVFGAIDERWGGSEKTAPNSVRINSLLRDLLPNLPPPIYMDRLLFASNVVLSAIVKCDRRVANNASREAAELNFLSHAIGFAMGGLIAPYDDLGLPMLYPPWTQS